MSQPRIHELTTRDEFDTAYPILVQLRDHLSRDEYHQRLAVQRAQGYRLFARTIDDEVVSLAGIAQRHNFYSGDHVFVYDLVTDADRRGEGHGSALLDFVDDWARTHDCEYVSLDSGLWRERAHAFYETHGFERFCYNFRKELR